MRREVRRLRKFANGCLVEGLGGLAAWTTALFALLSPLHLLLAQVIPAFTIVGCPPLPPLLLLACLAVAACRQCFALRLAANRYVRRNLKIKLKIIRLW